MENYRVIVRPNNEIVLPPELRDLLGLVVGDTLELDVDAEGKVYVRAAERSAGPLADFFEDLILSDLHAEGYSGDELKEKYLARKIQLSTVLDRLAEEAHRARLKRHTINWREAPELANFILPATGPRNFQLVLTARAERDLRKLPERAMKKVPSVFQEVEQDPVAFKRLKGPYYETYRVSLYSEGKEHYRVIYTVFGAEGYVAILTVGERKGLYEHLKGMS